MAAVNLPRALQPRGCQSISYVAGLNARYPVLLVHGYAASESMWTPLRRALAGAGFGHIVSVTYNSFATDPAAVTAELTDQGLRAAAAAGTPRVHLVGHSLGGLIVRCALAASAPLSSRTASAVTIASPHRGAWLARLAPGRFAPLMHTGGCPVRPEIDAPAPARWLAYYADRDRVVPPASARLDDPRYGAANLPILRLRPPDHLPGRPADPLPGAGTDPYRDLRRSRRAGLGRPRTDGRVMGPAMSRAGQASPAGSAPGAGASAFRQAMSSFATGVTVVTVACPDGSMHGLTVNSFTSVSLDPMLVLVCLDQASRGAGLIEQAGAFVVNVLSAGQQDISRWFANRHRPAGSTMFDGVPFEPGVTGCPVLVDAAASFDCRLRQSHRAGDHLIVLGEVVALEHRPELEPLIFHAGTYKSLERESRPTVLCVA